MDLDNFKGVNDSLGHAAGDSLLIEVAARMRSTVRPLDLVARLGGDEFAILVEDVVCPEDVGVIGSRVLAAFDAPFPLADREVTVRASLGIALSGADASGEDAPGLLRDADVAMYAAKSEGKSYWRVFDPDMQSPMIERLELLADLQRAIEQHEFILHYQPIYDLKSNRLHGVEALVRWNHPRRGFVSPGSFIPLAEECGAIIGLGRWVLFESCRQAASWHAEFPDEAEWAISDNVSPRQLLHPAFIADVREALAESCIEPGRLILEVTESALMQDVPLATSRILTLKEIGVRLAIDDFGTGYSSLSYLRDFPFDLLKIDRAFIADLGIEERGKELAAAIIELGRTLDLELVAEGIERTDQLSRLKLLGCTFGQGFHLAKPMDAPSIHALLSKGATFTEMRAAA
jgi:diguanylate cyclase (GGDEF)-like protein